MGRKKVIEGALFGRAWILLVLSFTSFGARKLQLVRKIPHSGYSEGLDFKDGFLWHALPKEILKIDLKDGTVVRRFTPASEYSESLKWVGSILWNVSFSDNGIYRGDLKASGFKFERKGKVPEAHAWGIEWVQGKLVVTGDYSDKLYFLNPKTLKVERTLKTEVTALEDLAWDGQGLWTSSFTTHRGEIFRVDIATGKIPEFFALPDPEDCPIVDGLAFDGKNLWVTGKNCPAIYCLKLPSKN